MKSRVVFLLGLSIMIFASSCNRTYKSSLMFKAKKDFEYSPPPDSIVETEFRIEPNDIIDFRLFTNDGFKLIDLSTMNDQNNMRLTQQQNRFFYLVEHDGNIKMPLIGRVNIVGMTIKEVEDFFEEKYSKFYIDPFARVAVMNRRVTVFNGEYSMGKVVQMENRNLRLIEALALAGGLPRSAKSHEIKVFRGDPKDPEIYHFDLRRVQSYDIANFVLESNDIVYVEPRIVLSSEILREWAPVLTLTTSILTLYVLIVSINNSN